MGKMNELAAELAELRRCGEVLIGISKTLAEMFSGADEEPAAETKAEERPVKKAEKKPKTEEVTLTEVRAVLEDRFRQGHTGELNTYSCQHHWRMDGLHKLPVSKSWEDMSQKPDVCKQMVENYCREDFAPYAPEDQTNYYLGRLLKRKEVLNIFWKSSVEKGTIDSLKASMEILTYFKNWVENNKGWEIIQGASSRNREKITQRIIHLSGLCYIQTNNLDMSCEPDEGRGPVDFKVSRGQDITIIEVKLSTNPNYCHGYKTQIEEYGKAENTNKLIYVLIDMGNPGRVKTIERMYAENLKNGKKTPEVLVVNAARRESASIY